MARKFQCVQIQQQLQYFDLEIVLFDFDRDIVEFGKICSIGRFSWNDIGCTVAAILFCNS